MLKSIVFDTHGACGWFIHMLPLNCPLETCICPLVVPVANPDLAAWCSIVESTYSGVRTALIGYQLLIWFEPVLPFTPPVVACQPFAHR